MRVDLTDSLKDGSQSTLERRRPAALPQRARRRRDGARRRAAHRRGADAPHASGRCSASISGSIPSNVLTMRLSLPQASYRTPEQVVGFYQRLLERVRATAGRARRPAPSARCRSASTIGDFGLRVEGYVPPPGTGAKGDWQIATDGYLEAIGERLVRGRTIAPPTRTDGSSSPSSTRRWPAGTGPGRIRSAGA